MRLKIVVGEPRDFDAGDKTNVIIGTVAEGLGGSRSYDFDPLVKALKEDKRNEKITEYWFVVSCNPVVFDGSGFNSLLVMPRYRTKKPPLELIGAGETIVCNCMWRQDGEAWDELSIKKAQEGALDVQGALVVNVTAIDPEK
ncbi:MAG: hypothetical protein HY954_05330 [Deltaproteobacteria bacterium]|nr:hypothetical protein [Deltaproteobacteria bacterium]